MPKQNINVTGNQMKTEDMLQFKYTQLLFHFQRTKRDRFEKGVDHFVLHLQPLLLSYSLQGLQHDDAVSPDDL